MRKNKLLFLIILALVVANSALAQSESRLHKILQSGELRVGTTASVLVMTGTSCEKNEKTAVAVPRALQ